MKKAAVLFILAIIIAIAGIPAFAYSSAGSTFSDINGHWAGTAISALAADNAFDGVYSGSMFKPDTGITRSEFAVLLHRALGIRIMYFKAPDITEFFDDVSNEASYSGILYDLASTGIIDCKGSFRPDAVLTREELVHFIMNGFRYKTSYMVEEAESETAAPFIDESSVADTYSRDIDRAYDLGLVAGRPDGGFYPQDSSSRAEAAVIISKLDKRLEVASDVAITVNYAKSGDFFDMTLEIANNSDEEVVLNHSSGYKYDFKLLDADKNILYTWSADKMFTMALVTTTIAPGEKITYTERLDYKSQGDILSKAAYLQGFVVGRSDDFQIDPDGYTVEIK